MTTSHPKRRQGKRRMDFSIEPIEAKSDAGLISVQMTPDPRRYDKIDIDGKPFYLDKYLKEAVSLEEMAQQMPGLPLYSFDPRIKNSPEYATSRLDALRQEKLTGTYVAPREKPFKQKELSPDRVTRDLTFISLDICGSTALRLNNPTKFDGAYQILIRELGTVVGQFGGSIFKTTGDGFIAFIDHPSFTRQCDNTIDLGLSLIGILNLAVNPALRERQLPLLNVRVGADYGEATIRNFEIPATGFRTTDLASDALNRAVKIQETCAQNEFRFGRSLYELVHVQWLERAEEVKSDVGVSIGEPGYQIYSIR